MRSTTKEVENEEIFCGIFLMIHDLLVIVGPGAARVVSPTASIEICARASGPS
jgi:hypothetical protein